MGIKCITENCHFEVSYDGPWNVTGHEALLLKPFVANNISQNSAEITIEIGKERLNKLNKNDLLMVKSPESSHIQDGANSKLPFILKMKKKVKKSIFLTCQAQHTNLYYITIDE